MFGKVLAVACAACCAVILVLQGCSLKVPGSRGFTILYSNDVRGEFENCGCTDVQLGGLSRKAHLLRSLSRKNADILRLDAGNLFFRKAPQTILNHASFSSKRSIYSALTMPWAAMH